MCSSCKRVIDFFKSQNIASQKMQRILYLLMASLPALVTSFPNYSFMLSSVIFIALSLFLLPSSLLSKICLCKRSCLFKCPKYFSLLGFYDIHKPTTRYCDTIPSFLFFSFSSSFFKLVILSSQEFLYKLWKHSISEL